MKVAAENELNRTVLNNLEMCPNSTSDRVSGREKAAAP